MRDDSDMDKGIVSRARLAKTQQFQRQLNRAKSQHETLVGDTSKMIVDSVTWGASASSGTSADPTKAAAAPSVSGADTGLARPLHVRFACV